MRTRRLEGISTKNGVAFDVPSCENMAVQAIREGGKIRTEAFNVLKTDAIKEPSFFTIVKKEYESPKKWWKFAIFYLVLLSISIALFAYFRNGLFSAALLFVMWDLLDHKITNFIFLLVKMVKNKELKAEKQMYAAMNMGRNAYEKLQRVPTIKEMRKNSKMDRDRIIVNYGSAFFLWFLTCIGLSLVKVEDLYHVSFVEMLIAGAVVTFFIWFGNAIDDLGFHRCLEIFFIKNPTDEQLEVVREAIRKVDEDDRKGNDLLDEIYS